MNRSRKHFIWVAFVAGLIGGVLAFRASLPVSGLAIVSEETLQRQHDMLASLQEGNNQLSEELFNPRAMDPALEAGDLPYEEAVDARAMVAEARANALEDRKFLMVTFGANWCRDCRTLHRNLKSDEVAAYTRDRFLFVNVDVGKFNRNTDLAAELGVDLDNGIPVAIFFDADGRPVGTTNAGELERARLYTSKQILKFVRDVAERSRILAPDAIR